MRYTLCFTIIALFLFSIISTPIVFGDVDSPRKQMANGVFAEDVVCKKELQLMLRSNGDAICVKLSSTTKFVDKGIAEVIDTTMRDLKMKEEKDRLENDGINYNSPEKILINSEKPSYKAGSVIIFTGTANPNQELRVSLEAPNENEVFSDILEIDSSGKVNFEVITDASFVDGTYSLISTQSDDSEIIPVRIGKTTSEITAVIEKFNHETNSQATLEILGPDSASISMTIFDFHEQAVFEDNIQLGPEGSAEYSIDLSDYKIGAYSIIFSYGAEEIIEEFTIGLRTSSTPIEINLIDDSYEPGDTAFLFGKTSGNMLILIEIIDSNGEKIDKIEYYTDRKGEFKYPLDIPHGKQPGTWKAQVSSGTNISEISFDVNDIVNGLTLELDRTGSYNQGDYVTISGYGLSSVSQVTLQITSATIIIDELTTYPTNDYEFSVIWKIPDEAKAGAYTILANSGTSQATTNLNVIGN